MNTILFSREPIYEPRELTEEEQWKFQEICEKVRNKTEGKLFNFANPDEINQYVNIVLKMVEEDSNFRVIKLEHDIYNDLIMTLEVKPQLSIILPKCEVAINK